MAKIFIFFSLARQWNGAALIIAHSRSLVNSFDCNDGASCSDALRVDFRVFLILDLAYFAGTIYFEVISLTGSVCGSA